MKKENGMHYYYAEPEEETHGGAQRRILQNLKDSLDTPVEEMTELQKYFISTAWLVLYNRREELDKKMKEIEREHDSVEWLKAWAEKQALMMDYENAVEKETKEILKKS